MTEGCVEFMRTKKDLEKFADNISPDISTGIPTFISRTDKILTISAEQEAEMVLDISIDKKS